jgi:UDP-glucose 4-epimerase
VALLEAGHEVLVADSFETSRPSVIDRMAELTGQTVPFVRADLSVRATAREALRDQDFDAVIHLAGLKAVGESVRRPERYYANNLGTTLALVDEVLARGVRRFVFSSSSTVYGPAAALPYREDDPTPLAPTNPYGATKAMCERVLGDVCAARDVKAAVLRYFNPVGAHESGLLGEDPVAAPSNLMPIISRVAAGRQPRLAVFGDDYATADGTCVRDYVHVQDIAAGHVAALERIDQIEPPSRVFNLGTGRGTSVLELIRSFERTCEVAVPFDIEGRRAGDLPAAFCDPRRAGSELAWTAERSLEQMCRDSWRWEQTVTARSTP